MVKLAVAKTKPRRAMSVFSRVRHLLWKGLLLPGMLVLFGAIVLLLWRYTPVRIQPTTIAKINFPDPNEISDELCPHFSMTVAQFSAYFASVHRLIGWEEDEYGYGGCYYETNIDGRTYRIWIGGTAQIQTGNKIENYAASNRKLPINP
jgi:hypothetical protein